MDGEEEKVLEKEVRDVLDKIILAYDNRDAKAMAEMTDDPFFMLEGVFKGRENLETLWVNLFRLWGTQKVVALEDMGIDFLTPDVAIWRGTSKFINRTDNEGNPLPPEKVVGANIYIKKEGRWLRAGAFVKPIVDPDPR